MSLKNYIIIISIISIFYIFYSQGLGRFGLEFVTDENFYYQSCRHMVESGDYTTPYYFEKKRFDKPILYYWFVSLFFKFFGINWSIARTVSLVFSALFLFLLYSFCLSFYDKKIAIISVLIAMSFLCFYRYSRVLLPETSFLFFLFGFLYLFLIELVYPKNKKKFLLAYASLGFATLLKGPVAVLLAFFTLVLYYRMTKRKFSWKETLLIEGVLIIGIIALPWFIRMIQLYGQDYVRHILIRETRDRIFFISASGWYKNLESFIAGIAFFIPIILFFYLPWSIFLPEILFKEFKAQKETKYDADIFLSAYIIVIFAFFCLIYEKHRHYMLYMTPPLAVFIAKYIYSNLIRVNMRTIFVAMFAATLISMYLLGVAVNRYAYTLDEMFAKEKFIFKNDDLIAIGSLTIYPNLLEANVKRPVLKKCIEMGDEAQTRQETWNLLNWDLFLGHEGQRSFCLITSEDYYGIKFHPRLEGKIRIIGSAYIAKKYDIKEAIRAIFKRDKKLFLDSFRREVLFITNSDSV